MESKLDNSLKKMTVLDIIKGFDIIKKTKNIEYSFSLYENGTPGQGITKSRTTLHLKDILGSKTLFELLKTEKYKNFELAVHSKVIVNNSVRHIPMIDFSISENTNKIEIGNILSTLQKKYNYKIYIFKTGHSFHGYMDALLDEIEWRHFLGSILLLNSSGLSNIIDSRWVAHSLENGFSALRLSNNTNYYLSPPRFFLLQPIKLFGKRAKGKIVLNNNVLLRYSDNLKPQKPKEVHRKGTRNH